MTDKEIELALETIALVLEDLKKTQEKQQATITAIKEALAEHAMRETQRLGQEIEQEQEPHGWYIDGYGAVIGTAEPKSVRVGEWLPWYTVPPQRTWVGLTDKDWNRSKHNYDFQKGVDWAEPILKQKNGYAEE